MDKTHKKALDETRSKARIETRSKARIEAQSKARSETRGKARHGASRGLTHAETLVETLNEALGKARDEARNSTRARMIGNAAICVAFLSIIGFFSLFYAFGDKPVFLEMENREPAPMPSLINDGAVNRDFYMQLERYYSDAFPFRESMLLANRRIQGIYTAFGIPDGDAEGGEDAVEFFSVAGGGSQAQPGAIESRGSQAQPGSIEGGPGADSQSGSHDNQAGIAGTATVGGSEPNRSDSSDRDYDDEANGTSGGSPVVPSEASPSSAPGNALGDAPGDALDDTPYDAHGGHSTDSAAASPEPSPSPAIAIDSSHNPGSSAGASPETSPATAPDGQQAPDGQPNAPPDPLQEPDGQPDALPNGQQPPDAGQLDQYATAGIAMIGDQAVETFVFDMERTRAYAAIVDGIAQKSGVPTYAILPPSAAELYLPEKYRAAANYQGQAFELLESVMSHARFIDLSDEFTRDKDDYIYFRTDHHWTADGAHLAYEKLGAAAGYAPAAKSSMAEGRLEGFLGSLYRQIFLDNRAELLERAPDFVRYFEPAFSVSVEDLGVAAVEPGVPRNLLEPNKDLGTNLYNVFFGGDTRLLHMHSELSNGRSIIVVRDSYGHAFLPFLTNNYEHVYAIEPRYFESFALTDFIAEHEIDELLFLSHSLSATSTYWLDWTDELAKLS